MLFRDTKNRLIVSGLILAFSTLSSTVWAEPVVHLPLDSPALNNWTDLEREQSIAIHHLYRSEAVSTHVIRIHGAEKPHVHDRHELNVTLLRGQMVLHFDQRAVNMQPGDVVVIPKGQLHWAENVAADASLAFVTFSPAFDGQDRRYVTEAPASK